MKNLAITAILHWRRSSCVSLLRDVIFTHPTAAEGLIFLLASVPAKQCNGQA
jgi:hypothetical protein